MERKKNVGVMLVKIAAIYMMAGLVGGIVMAVSKDHVLATVHSHVTLLGWTTMAITGLVYAVKPVCAQSRLSVLHFWFHNTGLPVMMVSLALYKYGNAQAEKFIGLGSTLVLLGLFFFTINVVKNLKQGEGAAEKAAADRLYLGTDAKLKQTA